MQIVELKICILKKLLVIIALLPASMLFAGMAMGAPTNISSCQAINALGEYVLNQSIIDSGFSYCINITSSDVVFDGMGYTIDGIDGDNTNGVYVYNSTASLINITVKNLAVTDWYYGIYFNDTANGTIENNTISSNSYEGIHIEYSSNNTISNNSADSNSKAGFALFNSNNNLVKDAVNSNSGYGIALLSSNNNTLINNTASSNHFGFYLSSSSSNTLTSNTASSNILWDFYSRLDMDNTVINLSITPTISFTGKNIAIKSVYSPAVAPVGYSGIGMYINITNNSADSWLFLNISYSDSDVTNMNENTLSMWKYNSSWSQVSNSGVEAAQNYIYANITSFSTFAPLGADTTLPSVTNLAVTPSSPQVGGSVNITVNIKDGDLNTSNLFVIVKHPNGFTNTSLMNGANGAYFYNYTNTSEYGRYNVTINASDITGNTNNTEKTWFVTIKSFSSIVKIHSEGNGENASGTKLWNTKNFPGLVIEEILNVQNVSDRVIPQSSLWYNTTRKIVPYKVNESKNLTANYSLDSEGNKIDPGGYYAKIGWQGISYVALNGKANKLAMLLVEQGNASSDKKTFQVGETWDMGDGYTLRAMSIDAKAVPKLVWLELNKRGVKLDDKVVAQGKVYTFSFKTLAGESNVPIFVTYVDSVFAGATSDMVQLKYTWLISENVTQINASGTFGVLTVAQSGSSFMNLTNSNDLTLSQSGTINLMDTLYFQVENNASLEYYPLFQTPTQVNASDADVSLEIFTNTGVPGIFEINKVADLPPGINRSLGLTPFGKYISINSTSNVVDNLSRVIIKIYYTEDELKASGFDEKSLKIAWRNEDTDNWETLAKGSPSWVNDAGLNTTNINGYSGFVWVNVSHFSYYGLAGEVSSPQTPNNPGGGGSGGGGGGGTSSENYTNIESKEKYDLHIFKNNVTSYKFTHSDPILFVNITGNINAGEITTLVEILKNTSSLVKTPAPGIVYKNINIWVGTSGFVVPRNIKEAIITFRVKNSWLAGNNIQAEEIFLLNWGGDAWNKLETKVTGMDDKYTYMESKGDAYPNFAISGIKGIAVATSTPVPTAMIETTTKTLAPTATASQPAADMGWAFALVGFMVSATAGYFFVIKKRLM